MDITYTHCAGLDVHKKSVVVCCLTPGGAGELLSETRTFGTMTHDVLLRYCPYMWWIIHALLVPA